MLVAVAVTPLPAKPNEFPYGSQAVTNPDAFPLCTMVDPVASSNRASLVAEASAIGELNAEEAVDVVAVLPVRVDPVVPLGLGGEDVVFSADPDVVVEGNDELASGTGVSALLHPARANTAVTPMAKPTLVLIPLPRSAIRAWSRWTDRKLDIWLLRLGRRQQPSPPDPWCTAHRHTGVTAGLIEWMASH
jgi:hypothetical protein